MTRAYQTSLYSILKSRVIQNRFYRFLDGVMRFLVSFIPILHGICSRKWKIDKHDEFIFFLYGGLGDCLLVLDLINTLARFRKITIFCDFNPQNIACFVIGEPNIISIEKNNAIAQLRKYRLSEKIGNKIFIQTSPVFECYLVSQLLGIKRSVGFLTNFYTIRSIGLSIRPQRSAEKSRVKQFERLGREICSYIGVEVPKPNANYRIKSRRSDDKDKSSVVVSVTKSGQWDMGRLPVEQYVSLVDLLIEHGVTVLLVGNHSERSHIEKIYSSVDKPEFVTNLAGKTSVQQLSSLIKQARFVVANDNGVAHMSAFLGARVLTIFLFSDPEVYKWPSENYQYLFNKITGCMPCIGSKMFPQDHYPFKCKNRLVCQYAVDANMIIDKLKVLSWLPSKVIYK